MLRVCAWSFWHGAIGSESERPVGGWDAAELRYMACVSGGAGAERGQRRREPRAGEAAARLTVRSWGCVAPPARWRFHVWRLDLDLEARARGRRRAAGGGGASGEGAT